MIYLDAAATTPVRREVIEAMFPWLTNNFGNPSSHHELGERAAVALADSRQRIASILGCHAEEIFFTSGGTEADNLIIKGIALARHQADPHLTRIVISAIEHPAVMEAARYLERLHGFTVDKVPVDAQGLVDRTAFEALLENDAVALVSVMYANNEVGTVQDITELTALAHERGIPFHSDCVQAASWLSLDTRMLGVDALSISGHKVGAPKGIGVAYISSNTAFEPLIHGGGQERGGRSGTENVAFAVAMAKAMEMAEQERAGYYWRVSALRDAFIERILCQNPNAILTGHPSKRLPSIASFCFAQSSGESLLLELERKNILSSSGSACAAGSDEPSEVLTALGIAGPLAQTALRFSMSAEVSEAELDVAADEVSAAVVRLNQLANR